MTKPKPDAPPATVDAFFMSLDHPHADALQSIRAVILDADPSISEAIKWNVPSFQTTEFFATLHLRAKSGVGVVLHFGVRKGAGAGARAQIADPAGLLQWLADDRAMVAFRDAAHVHDASHAFTRVIGQWIRFVV